MKKILLALIAASALSMTACATDGVRPNIPVASIPQRAETEAENAYNAAARAYLAADARGLLTPDIKGQVKPKMMDAFLALQKARAHEGTAEAALAAIRDAAALLPAVSP